MSQRGWAGLPPASWMTWAFDAASGRYYMLYTCFNSGKAKPQPAVTLCLASAADPTRAGGGWVRHGPVGFGAGSKSGALLVGWH